MGIGSNEAKVYRNVMGIGSNKKKLKYIEISWASGQTDISNTETKYEDTLFQSPKFESALDSVDVPEEGAQLQHPS